MMLLVIGYGNELRGDDGVGPAVAREVDAWGLPDVSARWSHGLVPELAEPISRADAVVFVDAKIGGAAVEVSELAPGPAPRLGHHSEPRWLLRLAEVIGGRAPRAWLLTIPADDFGPGEGLSERARRGMADALERIHELRQRASSQVLLLTPKL